MQTGRGIIPFLVANSDKHNNAHPPHPPPPTHISPPPSNYLLNFSMSRSASSMSLLSSSSSGLGINTSSEKQPRVYFLKTTWKKNTTKPSNLVQTNLVQTQPHLQNYIFVQFSVWHSCICADCKGDAPRPLIPTPLYPASGPPFTIGPKELSKHCTHILSVIAIGRFRRGC